MISEAKPIIGYFKLQKINTKLYENESILLVIGSIGLEKTKQILTKIFTNYSFKKAINIGICGCKDTNIEIGSLFCTNKKLEDISYQTLQSFDTPVTSPNELKTTLVDMEAEAFIDISSLNVKDIYVFKIVSDHLNSTIPTKAFVNALIQKNIKKIAKYV